MGANGTRVHALDTVPVAGPVLGDGPAMGHETPPAAPEGLERRLWLGATALTGALGLVGFAVSFAQVEQWARPSFGWWSWAVPAVVDGGIFAFTGLDLLMAYRGVRSPWLRFVPWALIAATIYLNTVDEPSVAARVAHAVLPLIWAIWVEVAGGAARTVFGMRAARPRLERIRRSRWLLAPIRSARDWRWMVLHEVPSYRDALAHRDALLASEDALVAAFGRKWRKRAPRLVVRQLKRGVIPDLTALTPAADARPTASASETRPDASDRLARVRELRDANGGVMPSQRKVTQELKVGRPAAAALIERVKAEQ